jgi:hypothetical protein
VPLLCLLAGIGAALGALALDRSSGYTLVPQTVTGSPGDAQTILTSFATATATLISLVLTVTLVVVQLAMGQLSPRIVRALLNDRPSQFAIGLFGATFVVAILTLREIRGSEEGTVPGVAMLLAFPDAGQRRLADPLRAPRRSVAAGGRAHRPGGGPQPSPDRRLLPRRASGRRDGRGR